MRIQHNIAALNSYRNLTNNNSAVSKNLEKLSSGYRINRAGDDAAGLAISEKMRAQITGLEVAQKNANDGISLVQTAEGALTEVHTMLNRMVELANQSANGTYQDEVDRENLQAEMDSLKDEINRISQATNFNGIQLLDGSLSGGGSTGGIAVEGTINGAAITANNVAATKSSFTTGALTASADGNTEVTIEYTDENGNAQSKTISFTVLNGDAANSAKALIAAVKDDEVLSGLFDVTGDNTGIKFESKVAGANVAVTNISIADTTKASIASADNKAVAGTDALLEYDLANVKDGDAITINGKTYTYNKDSLNNGADGTFKDINGLVAAAAKDGVTFAKVDTTKFYVAADANTVEEGGKGLTLQIGDTSADFNQLTVYVDAMDCASLGIDTIDISTQEGAKGAVDLIKSAINKVSSTRGDLGALQNRLEHTINNLSVTAENMTAAESRIRDVDMAEEMMAYTKNNILVQASQAMLAQANQVPQGVLQLLQ